MKLNTCVCGWMHCFLLLASVSGFLETAPGDASVREWGRQGLAEGVATLMSWDPMESSAVRMALWDALSWGSEPGLGISTSVSSWLWTPPRRACNHSRGRSLQPGALPSEGCLCAPPVPSRWGMGAWALTRGPRQNTTAFTINALVVRYILNSETLNGKNVQLKIWVELGCKI